MKSRSGALACPATRQLPRRFLPLLPREIHPAGIASVPAGDVRAFMRQDGAAGVGRQQLQQRQPEPQHVARAAPEPPMLPDAGIAFAVQVDRVQHRRAHLGAHLFDLAEQRRRVRGRESRPSSGRVGVTRRAGAASPSPRRARAGQRLGGHAQRAGQRRIQPQRRRAQRQSRAGQRCVAQQQPGRQLPSGPARARHAYCASGGRQVLGADAASAHVGAEHRADGLDQAVRIQHLRLDLVDAFVVRLQPAGVLRPFDGGEAILPGAAPVRVGQRDLWRWRAPRASRDPRPPADADRRARLPAVPARCRGRAAARRCAAAPALGARLLACAVKQAQNLVQVLAARNPVRLRRCCDRPCCTWPAANLLPPRAAATGRAPRRPGSCPACCRGSPGGCRTCCWPRPPRGGPPAAGSGNSLAHGRRHPTAWRPPPRR